MSITKTNTRMLEGEDLTLVNTSAGASTTPLVLHNASSDANTDVNASLTDNSSINLD